MNLKSKWEWLSHNKDEPSVSPQRKPRPPPIAPKPKLFQKISATIVQESPVTFDEVYYND